MTNKTQTIVEYYDNCETDYRLFWDLDRSLAMHAGYWDNTTKTLNDALRRENEVLAEMAQIKKSDRVLDAGCGVGGSSLFLARKIGCPVVGISLSDKQIAKANNLASKESFTNTPEFLVMDFTKTSFPSSSFDVIWGIESVCHAANKDAFIREAHRLLKPGGRLIVADGFGQDSTLNKSERRHMSYWLNGWGVDALESVPTFQKHLETQGFQQITYRNITENVMPSSKRLYYISFPALVYSKLGEWTGLRKKIQTDNIWGAYYQYTTLKKNLWEYGIFMASKN